ncbi:sensor histidine kinase [bacterium]|nr:sensor histidine kinase [bacterium]
MDEQKVESLRELGRSGGVPAALAYPILTFCTGTAGRLWVEHPRILGGTIAALCLCGALREGLGGQLLRMQRERLLGLQRAYVSMVLLQAVVWSTFAALVVHLYPSSWTSLMAIMVTGGLVAGATASLNPYLNLMRAYIGVANLPVILTLLASRSQSEAMVAATLITFCAFMMAVGARNAVRYHRLAQALNDLEEARKESDHHRTSWQNLAEDLRSLAAAQGKAVEKERLHLAREIHDDLGQLLTGLKLSLARLSRYLDSEKAGEVLLESNQLVDTTLSSVRRISSSLRPPLLDELGLQPALDHFISEQCRRAQLDHQLKFATDLPALSPEQNLTAFRVCQEAVTNVIRHARATRVRVEVQALKAEVHISVSDDGVGMRSEQRRGSLGLVGLRERLHLLGGQIRLDSQPGQGTTLKASFPIEVQAGQG